jgi:sec-independent protein translocase protein TatC
MAAIFEELGYITEALKKKLIPIIVIILAGFLVSFQLLDPVLFKIKQDLLPEGATLIYLSPVEVIMLKVKLAMVIGVILALPLVCHYVYKTLKVRFGIKNPLKKSHLVLLLGSAVSLFVLGMCYSYFLMLPFVLKYLYGMSLEVGVSATYSIYDFVSFVIILTLILGVAFEVPIFIVFAVHTGLVPIATLKEYRRYIIVIMFALAAIVTPPDVVSQIVVGFPLVIFYEVGIIVASIIDRRRSIQLQVS